MGFKRKISNQAVEQKLAQRRLFNENLFDNDPEQAYRDLMNNTFKNPGRWPLIEPYVLQSAHRSLMYAKRIIGARWYEAEARIISDSFTVIDYHKHFFIKTVDVTEGDTLFWPTRWYDAEQFYINRFHRGHMNNDSYVMIDSFKVLDHLFMYADTRLGEYEHMLVILNGLVEWEARAFSYMRRAMTPFFEETP